MTEIARLLAPWEFATHSLDKPASPHYKSCNMMLARVIDVYSFVLLAAVVVSWTGLPPEHPVQRVLRQLTEPLLRPIRAVLPAVGGFDLSPMVLLIGLQMLARLLR